LKKRRLEKLGPWSLFKPPSIAKVFSFERTLFFWAFLFNGRSQLTVTFSDYG
jgi:hypothetical protein